MHKPIIGIPIGRNGDGDFFLRRQYEKMLCEAGAEVIFLPSGSFGGFCLCDGLLLSGGGDLLPEAYGLTDYNSELLFEPDGERDAFELVLAREANEKHLPVLGICRGIQVMNVALGGDLVFDLGSKHRQTLPRDEPSHNITLCQSSFLSSLYQKPQLSVNSFHHQSVRKLGRGLQIAARSGTVIEAIESTDGSFFIGVQWHPEHLADSILFAALVSACR